MASLVVRNGHASWVGVTLPRDLKLGDEIDVRFELDPTAKLVSYEDHAEIDATSVSAIILKGDFNDWAGVTLERVDPAFSTVVRARVGTHYNYKYYVDNKWYIVAGAPLVEAGGFRNHHLDLTQSALEAVVVPPSAANAPAPPTQPAAPPADAPAPPSETPTPPTEHAAPPAAPPAPPVDTATMPAATAAAPPEPTPAPLPVAADAAAMLVAAAAAAPPAPPQVPPLATAPPTHGRPAAPAPVALPSTPTAADQSAATTGASTGRSPAGGPMTPRDFIDAARRFGAARSDGTPRRSFEELAKDEAARTQAEMIGLLEGRLAREAARAKAAEARVAELERALEHFMAGGGGGREQLHAPDLRFLRSRVAELEAELAARDAADAEEEGAWAGVGPIPASARAAAPRTHRAFVAPSHAHSASCNHSPTTAGRLVQAARFGDVEGVKTALAGGCSTEETDVGGWTPAIYAAFSGHIGVLQALAAAGADLEVPDETERTPTTYAARNGHTAALRLLAGLGCDLNRRDEGGMTPSAWAAAKGYTDTLDVLVAAGANLRIADNAGKTPLVHATEKQNAGAIAALQAAGVRA